LPAYQIAAPDLLQVEMIKQIPLPPYRVEIYDWLQIRVVGTLLDQPIDNYYRVEGEGVVNLGPAYGEVIIAGMTIEEVEKTITEHLLEILRAPEVSVQLAMASGTQPVSADYLVAPDGTINLRRYGSVRVAGLTVSEAEVALENHLAQFFDSPEVSVNVGEFRSKAYYVISEGAGLGDSIVRLPITGKETVLDAIGSIGGLSQVSSKEIWVARPAPGGFGCEQILPVDYKAITRGASTSTNFQLLPGDRVFIGEDRMVAADNFIAKLINPIQEVLGVASLGTSTTRGFQTLGRNYNLRRGGNY